MKKTVIFTLAIFFSPALLAQWIDGGSNIFTFDKVGVGTTSPYESLHVNGSVRGNQSGALRISTGYGYMDIGPKNTSWAHFGTDRARFYFEKEIRVNTGYIGSYDENLSLRTSGTTRMTINNTSGYVGIGTTSPSYKLDVRGTIGATGGLVSIGASYSHTWMRFNQDQYGNSLILGGGGLTALGAGESATQIHNQKSASEETLYLTSDNGVALITNLQSGWGSRVEALTITKEGNFGIGTTTMGSHRLAVEGSIGAREVLVEAGGWSDFVFNKDYELPSLLQVEAYINLHGHLPDVPSEAEVMEQGINLGEMDAVLLQKIEELTLYMIDLKKENLALKEQIETLQHSQN